MKNNNKIIFITKEANKKNNNLYAIKKDDKNKNKYLFFNVNPWRAPFLTLKHNNFYDLITFDFLFKNFNIYNNNTLINKAGVKNEKILYKC